MPPSGLWCGSESRPAFIDVFHVRGLASLVQTCLLLGVSQGSRYLSGLPPASDPGGRWAVFRDRAAGRGVFHRLVVPLRLRFETVGGCVASVGNKVGT
jgi:hypothetical protein